MLNTLSRTARRTSAVMCSRAANYGTTQLMTFKVDMENPIVEIDGDEMAHVMWQMVKKSLILPYVDLKTKYFDLSLYNRDRTNDEVTSAAAQAIKKYKVGVKCSTAACDRDRIDELGLKQLLPSENGQLRNILGGTMFREPILCRNVKPIIRGWTKPIIIGRHADANEFTALDFTVGERGGEYRVKFTPNAADISPPKDLHVHSFSGSGVALGMYNTEQSMTNFAHSCFRLALERSLPLYFGTKSSVMRNYDGRFRDIFQLMYDSMYKRVFENAGIKYEYRSIDALVADVMKSDGGFVWATKNYDGDVQSAFVAQAYGSLGLTSSVTVCPETDMMLSETAHGTVRRHLRTYGKDVPAGSNPVATIFAWSRGLAHRAKLDDNEALMRFARTLEAASIATIESGKVTKDLVGRVQGPMELLSTMELVNAIRQQFDRTWAGGQPAMTLHATGSVVPLSESHMMH